MPTELKPCPFCGGKADFSQEPHLGLIAVVCKNCMGQIPYQFDFGKGSDEGKRKAIEAWNRRINNEILPN